MKISVFPDTSGDVILALKPHDNGTATLDVVNSNGSTKEFGQLCRVTDGGGHVEAHCGIIADNLGFERENERLKVSFD